jgi:hypothetical protein
MLIKVLGAIDFVGGLILMFFSGFKLPIIVSLILGGVFLIKSSMGFLKNFGSWIDLLSGMVFLLLMFFPIYWIICVIFGILLVQKGIFSFL